MKSQLIGLTAATLVLLFATTVQAQNTGTGTGTTGGTTTGTGTTGTTGTGTTGTNFSPATGFTQLTNTGAGASMDSVRNLGTTGVAGGGTTTTGGRGGGGGLGGFSLGGFGASGFGQSSTQAQPALRTRLRSSVSVAPLQTQQIQSSAQSRFYQTPATSRLTGVQVNMIDGTAVTNGVVRSEKDRRMSELLMRLEPGVRNVNNQVIVSP